MFWQGEKCDLGNSDNFEIQKLKFSKSTIETEYNLLGSSLYLLVIFGLDS